MKHGLIPFLLILTGCGIAKDARDTLKAVQTSNDKQQALLDRVHLQVLTVAMQQMTAPENTDVLVPPTRMMPYAKVLVDEASPYEITEIFYSYLSHAQYGGTTDKDNPTEADLRVQSRRVSITAAGLIAAFAPPDKLKAIQDTQIVTGGRFEDAAYAILAARYVNLRDYFFGAVVQNSRAVNLDSLRQAVNYFNGMKSIATLPYVDKIHFEVPAILADTDPVTAKPVFKDLSVAIDLAEPSRLARGAVSRFTSPKGGIPASVLATDAAKALLAQLK